MARIPRTEILPRRLARDASRNLPVQYGSETDGAVVSGCTCGSAEQLEEERRRLAIQSRSLQQRVDAVAAREHDLEVRAEDLDADYERLELGEEELLWSKADAEAGLLEAERRVAEVSKSEQAQTQTEEELAEQGLELQSLAAEVDAGEAAIAEEELELLEARGRAESEFQSLSDQREFVEQEALSMQWEFEDCGRQLDEVEREQWALEADRRLLGEIESQVAPIRRRLIDRERRLQAEEDDLRAREADCEEREAQLLPEYQCSFQAVVAAESRQKELDGREAESREQQQRLLQQQRNLGGEEIRLSGIEGALQRHSSVNDAPVAIATSSVEEMRRKLTRLKGSESDWAERLRLQQLEVQQLEVRLLQLQAGKEELLPEELPSSKNKQKQLFQ
eukprot:TRINITY_DN111361_c0_g1_i1.p1 TRINITY_DN111361_c0_g1~~TRINITY_DN111361_c0_g1_i1.p1  ORF type:complete len:402 (+),score=130.53 TRINITY_DN111361_c0_g1_i1:30-1208(+)